MLVIGYYFGLGSSHLKSKEIKIEINIVNKAMAFTSRVAIATIRRSYRLRGCRLRIFLIFYGGLNEILWMFCGLFEVSISIQIGFLLHGMF